MKFMIGFEKEDAKKLHQYWDEIILNHQWSEGKFTKIFEEKWGAYVNSESVSFSSWSGAALAALEFFNIRNKVVLCPSNTFIATPLSILKAKGRVEFVDCNKDDLCISFEDLKIKAQEHNPAAVWVVHIGGHISFQIDKIAEFCKQRRIILLEDCAHAHGASWSGKKAGVWGDAGVYSFYATKTISTGEGGMLCSNNKDLIEYAKKYRNYGKFDYKVEGLNYRMSEFTSAIGCVQVDRLAEIVSWKNEYAKKHLDPKFSNRIKFPNGMTSGLYKYIVFDKIENSTGKVYEQPCHKLMGRDIELLNTEWIAMHHWCAPLYYKGDEEAIYRKELPKNSIIP